MKKFAPQLRTCGFADYLSQTPSAGYKYTCELTAEKNDCISVALITLHRNVKVNYTKSI